MDNLTRERFEEKIDKSAGCHVWTGAKSNIGYGQLKIRGKIHYAHRLAYELAKGPIPDGRVIDHICQTALA